MILLFKMADTTFVYIVMLKKKNVADGLSYLHLIIRTWRLQSRICPWHMKRKQRDKESTAPIVISLPGGDQPH